MGIAINLKDYLRSQKIKFDLVEHDYCEGSFNTASTAHIPAQHLAKAVVFRDQDLHYVMCVLPSNCKVRRFTLNQIFDRNLKLADEDELGDLFVDCSPGAIPAIGQAYGLNVIYEDELLQTDKIFIEAGDHQHLICINKKQFEKLMSGAMHEHFSATRQNIKGIQNSERMEKLIRA